MKKENENIPKKTTSLNIMTGFSILWNVHTNMRSFNVKLYQTENCSVNWHKRKTKAESENVQEIWSLKTAYPFPSQSRTKRKKLT